ncbi:MAG: 3-oxoacyl-[acyl-carrier-protein] reductase [Rickettsiales bacterium]
MFNFTDKKILVTGASGGIGKSIAQNFYNLGANLAISGSNQEKLDSLTKSLGNRASAISCDLSQLSEVDNLIKNSEEKLGGLDVLVCNAGVTKDNLALRMKDDEWQKVIDINLTASFRLARTAIKGMLKRRSGRIIFITSIVGWTGNPGQTNYCASKAGLTGMSKALAQEVAARGITVNCVAPGFIDTPMTDILNDDQKSRISQNIPLGRMGTPEEISAGVIYLASDAASYITGQTLHINGGLYMG